MSAAVPLKRPVKVGQLVRRRLRELQRSPRELAEVAEVPERYITDLLTGRRQPPAPGRTDLYERMTKFLRLHRNDLSTCARAERAAGERGKQRPHPKVRERLMALCDPGKARLIDRRLARKGSAPLDRLIAARLLDVAQGLMRRVLDDEVGLRLAASRNGRTYLEMRMRVLDFLDATAETLTADDHDDFLRPHIAAWDIDLETHTMRIVLRTHEPAPRQKRALSL